MISYVVMVLLGGFGVFLVGFGVFISHESRKFGDNQFTMKLLPPPATPEKAAVSRNS